MAGQVIQGEDDEAMSDINVVPLTDVMLVLLIVFLITTQVIKQAVPIKLPNVRYQPTTTKPDNVSLTVRNGPGATCEVYWGVTRVTQKELLDRASRSSRTRSRRSAASRTSTKRICPRRISAAT